MKEVNHQSGGAQVWVGWHKSQQTLDLADNVLAQDVTDPDSEF